MDNLNIFSFLPRIIGILHWLFYGFFIIGIIVNAEAWFFGLKLSGMSAQVFVLSLGIGGLAIGYFIFIKTKKGYFAGIVLFIFMIGNAITGHFIGSN